MATPRGFPPASPGTIVWCRFPEDRTGSPGPKPRPALVVAAGEIDGAPGVEVAYGTTKKVDRLFVGEFVIVPGDGAPFRLSGLSHATKFDLSRRIELPFNDQWFAVAPGAPFGQTPQMGFLHPELMRRAQAAFRARR